MYDNGADKKVFPHFYTLRLYLPVATLIVMNMKCIFINHKAVSTDLVYIIEFSSLVHFSLGLQKALNNIYQKVQNRFTLIWCRVSPPAFSLIGQFQWMVFFFLNIDCCILQFGLKNGARQTEPLCTHLFLRLRGIQEILGNWHRTKQSMYLLPPHNSLSFMFFPKRSN